MRRFDLAVPVSPATGVASGVRPSFPPASLVLGRASGRGFARGLPAAIGNACACPSGQQPMMAAAAGSVEGFGPIAIAPTRRQGRHRSNGAPTARTAAAKVQSPATCAYRRHYMYMCVHVHYMYTHVHYMCMYLP